MKTINPEVNCKKNEDFRIILICNYLEQSFFYDCSFVNRKKIKTVNEKQ